MATGLRTWAAGMVVAALVAGGCSWSSEEPGLFRTPAPSATRVPSTPAEWPAPEPTNPELPVAGEAVWTTGDGSRVRVRFAVHAVRRTENATVLDWSVTPLPARGRPAGRPLPAVDLGLNRWLSGEQNLALLDVAGARAYRPLASVSPGQFSRCLCTPLFVAIPSLRFGETRLLQLSFPALPAGLDFVDVQLPNVASISHVPVTPAGSVPRALAPTDLARAGVTVWPATPGKTWTQPGRLARRETIRVDRVVAAPGLTSVEWTLRTVDDQTGFTQTLAGEPTARPIPDGVRVVNRSPASAPRIRVGSRELGTRWTTASFAGLPSYECLCSELDIWARGLREAGGSVHLSTTLPALPRGTTAVDVSFPGLPTFDDVPVTTAPDAAVRVRPPVPRDTGTWTYDEAEPPRGWTTAEWPTPVPAAAQVRDYQSRTERLLDRLP